MFPPRGRLTDGERNFYVSIAGLGLLGAVLAYVTIQRFSVEMSLLHGPDARIIWICTAGAVGGICAFLSCYRSYLGHRGFVGWLRAIWAGILITGIGAVIAGTLILPYYGTMFGPFQMVVVMIEYPSLAMAWGAMLICAHKLMQPWRQERDSIFAVQEDPLF